jgi:hypothetical protein
LPRYAEIENDLVINVIIADSDFIAEHKPEAIECPDFIGVGDKYIDGKFEKVIIVEVINELAAE